MLAGVVEDVSGNVVNLDCAVGEMVRSCINLENLAGLGEVESFISGRNAAWVIIFHTTLHGVLVVVFVDSVGIGHFTVGVGFFAARFLSLGATVASTGGISFQTTVHGAETNF